MIAALEPSRVRCEEAERTSWPWLRSGNFIDTARRLPACRCDDPFSRTAWFMVSTWPAFLGKRERAGIDSYLTQSKVQAILANRHNFDVRQSSYGEISLLHLNRRD